MTHTDKQPNNPVPNGSDTWQDPSDDDNESAANAPACPKGARCHVQLEKLHARNLQLQREALNRKSVFQTALGRRELACDKKDTSLEKQKAIQETELAKQKSRFDSARQLLAAKHARTELELGRRLMLAETSSKSELKQLKETTKLQAWPRCPPHAWPSRRPIHKMAISRRKSQLCSATPSPTKPLLHIIK